MKSKFIISFFIALVVSIIAGYFVPFKSSTVKCVVEVVNPVSDEYRIYYDLGKVREGYPFNQDDCVSDGVEQVQGSAFLTFHLPARNIRGIRLDPGNKGGTKTIRSLRLYLKNNPKVELFADDIVKCFSEINRVDGFYAKDGLVYVCCKSDTPQLVSKEFARIYNKLILKKTVMQYVMRFLVGLLSGAFIFTVIFFVKMRYIQNMYASLARITKSHRKEYVVNITLLVIVFTSFYYSINRNYVDLDLKIVSAPYSDQYSVYYDAGRVKNGYPYNQFDVVSADVYKTTGLCKVKFHLPLLNLKGVRLDLGNRPGEVVLQGMELSKDGNVLAQWDANDMIRDFPVQCGVGIFKEKDGSLYVKMDSGDAQILSGTSFIEKYKRVRWELVQNQYIYIYTLVLLSCVAFLLSRKFSIHVLPLFTLSAFLFLYIKTFWNLPVAEDSAYYAFISKCMSHGSVLHRDIPISTNSLGLYITSIFFKVFGSNLNVYRSVHAPMFVTLILLVYILVFKLQKSRVMALFASLLCGIYVGIPDIMFDLFGRNYIIWSMVLILAGMQIKFFTLCKFKDLYFGAFLGGAALFRETYLIVSIAALTYYVIEEIIRQDNSDSRWRGVGLFSLGLIVSLSINAIILTCFDSWPQYLRDMLHSGCDFRYRYGFFSYERIKENLISLSKGVIVPNIASSYYSLLIVAAGAYFIRSSVAALRFILWYLMPVLIFEAIIINKTYAYHIPPILVLCSILAFFVLGKIYGILVTLFSGQVKMQYKKKNVETNIDFSGLKYNIVFAGVAVLVLMVFYSGAQLVIAYGHYIRLAIDNPKYDLNRRWVATNEHTVRMLNIVNNIPHKTITTWSQYPLLFLSNQSYAAKPYVEDLTASFNLNLPKLWDEQMDYIENNNADLMVLKTMAASYDGYTPKLFSIFGALSAEKYVIVADFDFGPIYDTNRYRDRILVNKKLLNKYAIVKKKDIVVKRGMTDGCERFTDVYENSSIILRVSAKRREYIETLKIHCSNSMVLFRDMFMDTAVPYTVKDIHLDGLVKDRVRACRVVNERFMKSGVNIDDTSTITSERIVDALNALAHTPNLIDLVRVNMGLKNVRTGWYDIHTIHRNKQILHELFPEFIDQPPPERENYELYTFVPAGCYFTIEVEMKGDFYDFVAGDFDIDVFRKGYANKYQVINEVLERYGESDDLRTLTQEKLVNVSNVLVGISNLADLIAHNEGLSQHDTRKADSFTRQLNRTLIAEIYPKMSVRSLENSSAPLVEYSVDYMQSTY